MYILIIQSIQECNHEAFQLLIIFFLSKLLIIDHDKSGNKNTFFK